jgi:hypothetical protein
VSFSLLLIIPFQIEIKTSIMELLDIDMVKRGGDMDMEIERWIAYFKVI